MRLFISTTVRERSGCIQKNGFAAHKDSHSTAAARRNFMYYTIEKPFLSRESEFVFKKYKFSPFCTNYVSLQGIIGHFLQVYSKNDRAKSTLERPRGKFCRFTQSVAIAIYSAPCSAM